MSYNIGDTVIYGGEGLCKICGTEDKTISGRSISYYILKPLDNKNSVFYVPVESTASKTKMRKAVSAEEIIDLINKGEEIALPETDRERKEEYSRAIGKADRSSIISMVKAVCIMQERLLAEGKKFHKVDEYFLADAEKFLFGEFSLVFSIEKKDVIPFIMGKVKINKKR